MEKKIKLKKAKLKTKKKPKAQSKKLLKKKAWTTFSEFIRRKSSDENGNSKCVTCGKVAPWSELQAGHFVGGRTNSVLFNEDIVFPQCVHCNIFLRGNYQAYTLFMIDTAGRDNVDKYLDLKNKTLKLSNQDLKNIESYYQKKIDNMS